MDMSVVHSVENEDRPRFKIIFVKPNDGNPNLALFVTLHNIVYLEKIKTKKNGVFRFQ